MDLETMLVSLYELVDEWWERAHPPSPRIELRDGKMWRDRWYFAEPFEALGWPAQWVERMES